MLAVIVAISLQTSLAASPVTWTGGWSKIKKPEVDLVTNQLEWAKVWLRHKGDSKNLENLKKWANGTGVSDYNFIGVPQVDFGNYVGIAIFGGEMNQTSGFYALAGSTDGDEITFKYAPSYFQIGMPPKDNPNYWMRSPYALFLLPRKAEQRLKAIEGIPEYIGRPITKFKPPKSFDLPILAPKETE